MSKLIYIKASPRDKRSHSIGVANAFVESFSESHPGSEILTIELFQRDLPVLDGPALNAKYAILHGQEPSQGELEAWKAIESVIEEFKAADKYVFAVPMWNFGIPYPLKQYIDILVQPTYTFSFSPEQGYQGLVTGKPCFVAYSRGGEYPPGTEAEAFDFQKRYLESILGFIGFTSVHSLVVEPTLMGGPETAKDKREKAVSDARKMAREF